MTISKDVIEAAVFSAVGNRNLIYYAGAPDSEPVLRINAPYGNDEISITLGTPPGNAYIPMEGELFVHVGLPHDVVDYTECDDQWTEENAEKEATQWHIERSINSWVHRVWEFLNSKHYAVEAAKETPAEHVIPRRNKPSLKFEGVLLAMASSPSENPKGKIFRLYRTIGGNLIAAEETWAEGKPSLHRATVCKNQAEVVELWKFNDLPQKIYALLGWDFSERVE